MTKEFESRYKYYKEIRSIAEDIRSSVEREKPINKIDFIDEEIRIEIDSSRWMIYSPDLILAYSDNNDAWTEDTTLVEAAEYSKDYLPSFYTILASSVMVADIYRELDYLERLEKEEKKGVTNG